MLPLPRAASERPSLPAPGTLRRQHPKTCNKRKKTKPQLSEIQSSKLFLLIFLIPEKSFTGFATQFAVADHFTQVYVRAVFVFAVFAVEGFHDG